jgi:transcriptional regulator with XRE-family HTH domain
MGDIYVFIGEKIRELRQNYGGKGVSQEDLGKIMETTPNTISRWETATYKPSAKELHRLAQFFGVSISGFFPEAENPLMQALLSATGDLKEEELQDLIDYAQYRVARRKLAHAKTEKKRKK